MGLTQGQVTRHEANQLEQNGWRVAYVCVPGTPHVGVVPIPVVNGSCRQRYPDIVAHDGTMTLLLEVEPKLTASVSTDIQLRFSEQVNSLVAKERWDSWRNHVKHTTGVWLPDVFIPRCELVLVTPPKGAAEAYVGALETSGISVRVTDLF
jgi:hypothetical protein